MPYQRGGWLQNLLSGGNNVGQNTPIDDDIFGDVGYMNKKGRVVSNPYEDIRGFLARAAGAPNTAQELNLQLAQAGLLGNQANEQALALARGKVPIATEEAFNTTAAREGLSPEQQRSLSETKTKAKGAVYESEGATAGATKAKALTERQIAERARPTDVQTGVAKSVTGRNTAQRQSRLSATPKYGSLLDAASLANLLRPILEAQQVGTIGLPPNTISMVPSMGGLFPEGSPQLSLVPPGGVGHGIVQEHTVQPGRPIGTSGSTTPDLPITRTTPGGFNPIVPTNMEEINRLRGGGGGSPPVTQPFTQDLSTSFNVPLGPGGLGTLPPTTTQQIGAPIMQGGKLVAPITQQETPEAKAFRLQKEAAEAMENIKRILQQNRNF